MRYINNTQGRIVYEQLKMIGISLGLNTMNPCWNLNDFKYVPAGSGSSLNLCFYHTLEAREVCHSMITDQCLNNDVR